MSTQGLRCVLDASPTEQYKSADQAYADSQKLHDLQLKCYAAQERTKVLELENVEFQKEISELLQENEELRSSNQDISRQNSEYCDNKVQMVHVLSDKATALDSTHEMIESLQQQLNTGRHRIKMLHKQKLDLNSENELFKQRLEQSIKEKERTAKYVEELRQTVDELQHRLHMTQMSAINATAIKTPEDVKHNEEEVISSYAGGTTPTIKLHGALNRSKTVKWTFSPSNSPVPDTLHRDTSTASSASALSGFGSTVAYLDRQKSLQGLPETMPLMEDGTYTPPTSGWTPMTPNVYANYHNYAIAADASPESDEFVASQSGSDISFDAIAMQMRTGYKHKVEEMMTKHNKEVEELKAKLSKKSNTIKELRKKNAKLRKKAEKSACVLPQWCN